MIIMKLTTEEESLAANNRAKSASKSRFSKSKKPACRLVSLNVVPGLGIISTINMLFVIGFVDISREQSPHEGPHIKSLYFFEGYHEKLVCN